MHSCGLKIDHGMNNQFVFLPYLSELSMDFHENWYINKNIIGVDPVWFWACPNET